MATKLKGLSFLQKGSSIRWINTTLQTVKSKSLQHIGIYLLDFFPTVGGAAQREWLDLDHLLVRFWASYSIRPQVAYVGREWKDLTDHAPSLLPKLTSRRLIDLGEASG